MLISGVLEFVSVLGPSSLCRLPVLNRFKGSTSMVTQRVETLVYSANEIQRVREGRGAKRGKE